MMLYDFQKKIYELLTDNPEITDIGGVYDYIPEDKPMPFVVIGEDRAEEWNTKTWRGKSITTRIHVWGEARSSLPTKKLLGLIEDTLQVDFESNQYQYQYDSIGELAAPRESVELVHGVIEINYKAKMKEV